MNFKIHHERHLVYAKADPAGPPSRPQLDRYDCPGGWHHWPPKVATAYQLALAFESSDEAGSDMSSPRIVVVEPAACISPSASGQATGGLGDFGFDSDTAELSVLSYVLSQKVASRTDLRNSASATQPDPSQFCKFLYEECLRLGVKFIFKARATSVQPAEDTQHFSSIQVQKHGDSTLNISCRSIVIAAGPWSPRVFSKLFPHAAVKLPMNSTASAGNHFRVRTPGWKPCDDQKGSEQVFLQNDLPGGQGLDITSFLGGDLYVGGWGAIPEELPEFADAVKAQTTEIQRMATLAKQ
ncbi:Nn.00g049060.m01.CDS01 [Neocucurbitaria sp. VM-36]